MKDGYILKKFELFNWGTFDQKIETYYLDDDITVVSGDNGSGKSTVVDAFVSLLVPGRMRKYNLSATEGSSKKSRNELSYIKGAYKNEETSEGVKTAYLRGNKSGISTYSVILGYFRDEVANKEITMATFFRTTSNGVEKFYVISEQELYLKEDFVNILNNKELQNPLSKLKTILKTKNDTKIYTKFKEYLEDFTGLFGLRTNAIELFNKVVSLKEIKDLNSFFRENMLEKNPAILDEFEECEKNYLGVKDIYEKIIASEEKLKILNPFIENKKLYDLKNSQKKEINYYEQNLENYKCIIEQGLIETKIEKDKYSLESIELEKKEIEEQIGLVSKEIKGVESFLENNDTTKRINEINSSILLLEKDKNIREHNYKNYENYINILGLSFDNTIENFSENIGKINEKSIDLEGENEKQEELKIKSITDKNSLTLEKQEKDNELKYLKKRENLLPERLSKIRQKIAKGLAIDESRLKFVCELIKVKENHNEWLMPIEKLLHSFGQEMLVPENMLHEINKYVNENNLKGKIKYNKIQVKQSYLQEEEGVTEMLISKIDIKHNSEFGGWIKNKLLTRFNYLCLSDTNSGEYNKAPLVLTISGLIKNKKSYIKDDRIFGIDKYILGWDNKKKIALLEKEIKSLDKKILIINNTLEDIKKFSDNYNTLIKIFIKLDDIKTFSSVDFKILKKQIDEKLFEIKKLKENDSELKQYREKLDNYEKKLIKLNINRDEKVGKISNLIAEIKKLETKINYIKSRLIQINILEIKEKFENSSYIITDVSLDDIGINKDKILSKINNKKDKLSDEIQTLSNKMNGLSSRYREYKMTVSEKNEIGTNLDQLSFWKYLEEQYHKINDEELYKYRERFEKEFRETLFIRLNDFYNSLENECEYIKSKIDIINNTLKTINYSNETFIEVAIKNNNKKSDNIEAFKKEFREKVIYKKELDMTDKIKAFEDIKILMEKLIDKDLQAWRNNMIDVRNWFLFYIKENYTDTGELKDVFESSSGKSGGQTIKLAYSVLASALLYQYGIKEENQNLVTNAFSKSFRLVVIDEVFAKLDIDNSKYVLDLFKTLGLQLFIITPTNTINVLEDYVKSIYFISNISGDKSFKNKIDIKSRTRIEEKIRNKPESKLEREYMKKENENKLDLDEMKMEMF